MYFIYICWGYQSQLIPNIKLDHISEIRQELGCMQVERGLGGII